MATRPVITGAPTRANELSSFARTCAEHCPDPDVLDMIAALFTEAAEELRGQGRH